MKALLLASAFLALLAPQKGAVTVNVNAKNGETLVGERKFRVTVNANNPVTQVEFYVGNDLRDKDTSTPYEFVVDSLAETDGNLKLRFKAYTTEGENGEASVTVKIDNGVGKGAEFHISKATEALQDSKWDDAVTSARIALKADPKSNAARMILARAYLAKNDTAKAQKYAEDVLESAPGDASALDLLSAINIKAAFRTYIAGGASRTEALNGIKESLKAAVESRRKVLDAAVERVGGPTDANLITFTDTALRAGRYSLVVKPLQDLLEKDNRRADAADRLAYAYLRLGRAKDALDTLTTLKKYAPLSAFGFAASAIARAELNDASGSDDAIKEASLADADDLSVTAAQAYIALKYVRNRLGNTFNLNYDDLSGGDAPAKLESRKTLQSLVGQLEQAAGARTETQYYKEALYNKLAEYGKAQKAFEAAVLAEPSNYEAFIEAGNRTLASTQLENLPKADSDQALAVSVIMFETALTARPDSAQALTGLSLVATIQGRLDEAVRWGEGAVRANPNYAAGYMALGTAYNLASTASRKAADSVRAKSKAGGTSAEERQQLELQARKLEDQAGEFGRKARDAGTAGAKIDKRLEGQELTKPYAAWRYYSAGGRTPVLPLPR